MFNWFGFQSLDASGSNFLGCWSGQRKIENEKKNYSFPDLPVDIFLSIFRFCNKRELCQVMFVCKKWCQLGRNSQLWKEEWLKVGLKDDTDYLLLGKVNRWLKIVVISDPLLDMKMRKTSEIRKDLDAHCYSTDNAMRFKIINELQQNNKTAEETKKGFEATLSLYKHKLRGLPHLEKYAKVLAERYESTNGWEELSLLHIEENREDEAILLINAHLLNSPALLTLVKKIIVKFCDQKKWNEAIELIVNCSSNRFFDVSECVRIVFASCEENKELGIAEKLLEKVPNLPKDVKDYKLLILSFAYRNEGQVEKAQELQEKIQG